MNSPSGITVVKHDEEDLWDLMKTPDKKVNLHIPELLEDWLLKLPEVLENQADLEKAYPYNLIAGERRTYNANAVIRNLEWAKKDQEGFLKVHPNDAAKHGLIEGDAVELTSPTGTIHILVTITGEVQEGVISMPHGKGMDYGKGISFREKGAMPNILTTATYCDPLAKTPYHKNV